MARIDTYTAQRNLQPGNTPETRYSTAMAEELQGAGQAISSLAAELQQRNEQRENFAAENAYRRFKLELENDLNTLDRSPDGAGFHEKFMVESFRPKRDAFLNQVPDRLRPRFEAMLSDDEGSETLEWDIRSATVERDLNYEWQRTEITETQNRLATAITMNPDGYDALLADGRSLIEASSLPAPEKDKMLRAWREAAQTALLDQLLEDDPQTVLREFGFDARQLSPTTQFAMLSRAVQWKESRDNPNAVSPKGAIGLMQIMPGTAADVAKALGDDQFPHGAPENIIRAYLSNPYVNKRYGETYLKQQLKRFANTRDPIATALVAYNAGPSVAERWVESGYDDSILPKETRDYKASILDELKAPHAKGDPSTVRFAGNKGATLDGVNQDLQSRLADAYASIGLDTIRFNSGHRTEAQNTRAGGATKSQHLHGNAMDLDVSGMKIADRIELIKALSAAGITGIGIGANIIHADLGGRRAWGYATSAGGGDVPKWAQGVIAEHLAGTTPPIRRVAGRFGDLPYEKRRAYAAKADQLITAQQAQLSKSTAAEKVAVRQQRDNHLALVRKTGQGDPNFDETAVSTILGEDDYLKYIRDLDVAQRSFTATQGIAELTDSEMDQRLADYEPRNGDSFLADQEVQTAVQREINRVRTLRSRSPDRAALEIPELRAEAQALEQAINDGTLEPPQMQSFISHMLNTQEQLGVVPDARAPIPSTWARQIGKRLTDLPRRQNLTPEQRAKMTPQEQDDFRREQKGKEEAMIYLVYSELESMFGEYTDEVVTYALAEYKGVDKDRRERLGIYARAVQALSGSIFGVERDPVSGRALEQAADLAQSENAFRWPWEPGGWWNPEGEPAQDVENLIRQGGVEDELE